MNHPVKVWPHAKCRKSVDPDTPGDATGAEVEVKGRSDGNPTAR
jgi:hypothetical protein